MEIRLDWRCEQLIERRLRSGHYDSPEQVVAHALEALAENEFPRNNDDRQKAVQDMLAFADKHGLTLSWCFVDEATQYSRAVLAALQTT